MLKVDLHTHSTASPDGGITAAQYKQVIASGALDRIAITDHNRINFAARLKKELGDVVIVGEEVMTADGEIIGLFLHEAIPAGLTAAQTVKSIKDQGGLVYIPHPFETIRKGVTATTLETIIDSVDIIEVHNARAVFQNKGPQAATWAALHHKLRAASSDAHGFKGLGGTYTEVARCSTVEECTTSLASGRLVVKRPPFITLFYPKANRLRNRTRRTTHDR